MRPIGRLGLSVVTVGFVACACVIPANAMQFSTVPLDNPQVVVIESVGEIIPGDFDRLGNYILHLPPTLRIFGFALDSPGGNVIEAEKIANGFQRMNTTIGVYGQARCVSACFLLLAAGARRWVSATALIGVHSASEDGAETSESMAMTTAMARDAAAFGVPPAIIGKMVTSTPGQMQWLTQQDLRSMGVTILQPAVPQPATVQPSEPATTAPSTAATATVTPPTATMEPLTFQQGLADRRVWEQWYAALSGDYLSGASFWAEHRSDHKMPSCNGVSGADLGAFTQGCLAAQQRLANSDVRRKGDPDYRRGWNSY